MRCQHPGVIFLNKVMQYHGVIKVILKKLLIQHKFTQITSKKFLVPPIPIPFTFDIQHVTNERVTLISPQHFDSTFTCKIY